MELKLPELGEGVHEGELVKWKVAVGDPIRYDQPLCEVMTDKATIEIPSAFEGTVAQLHCKEGEIVHVGQLMLSFEVGHSKAAQPELKPSLSVNPGPSIAVQNPIQTPQPQQVHAQTPAAHLRAAPSTRQLARELGVNLTQVVGSGPQGRILRADLELLKTPSVIHGEKSFSQDDQTIPFRGLRKKIAEKMRLSRNQAAHFTYVDEADATELVKLRNHAKELGAKKGIKVTYLPFIMKTMAHCVKEFPILNSTLDETKGEIVLKKNVNISLSIQTEDGLVAPVIKHVESKSIFELAQEIQALVERARQKKLTLEDYQGGTITLTNAGSIGGLFTTPIINYPEVAILGLNKITKKPVVKKIRGQEEIVIRDWTYFSISLDHRIIDGAVGAEFMNYFIQRIENPNLLILSH